jgi:aminopeptidase-like protein
LTYGEHYIRGETEDEILLSCHICHPSLCNDNLS